MRNISAHEHSRLLFQPSDASACQDMIDASQLHVDLEGNVREILRL